jgi:hypothetical protein
VSVPAWILDIFAAIMLAVSAVSAARLARLARLAIARPWSRPAADAAADIDVAHVLMGIAMAGMLAAGLRTLPGGVWIAVFAVVTAWFAWRVAGEVRGGRAAALRGSHHLPHLVHGTAMVYMFAAVTTPAAASGGMSGMSIAAGAGGTGTLRAPTLALAFTVLMAAFAVTDLDLVSEPAARARDLVAAASASAPALATATAGATALPVATVGSAGVTGSAASAAADTLPAGSPEPASTSHHGYTARRHAGGCGLLDNRVTLGCRIAMGVTMALMVTLMI